MSSVDTSSRRVDASLFCELDGRTFLAGSACRTCGAVGFPAQRSCQRCTGTDVDSVALPGEGTLWAFTVQRFAPKTPYLGADRPFSAYAVGYVDLGGQVLVESRLVIDDVATLRIGQPMELVLERFSEDADGAIETYAFSPIAGGTR